MNIDQIALIQDSFASVVPVSDRMVAAFYDRVFASAPSVRPLFTGDMATQGRKLLLTLTTVVDQLDRPGDLLPGVRELAVRHVHYGVLPSHYPIVGAALIATLRDHVGPAWTPDVEAAWVAAYDWLSGAMIDMIRTAA